MDVALLWAVLGGIGLLLLMILRFKLPAFIALLIAAVAVGVFAGIPMEQIIQTLKEGMGNTLGFVAIVVGLGTLLGGLLEHSGGAEALAHQLLNYFGKDRTDWALVTAGFLLAIPVFFDVAFILLVPLIYSLQRKTGASILSYGIPLLAGLAITHAFIPPTPGPVAVAEILSANLGWVITFGAIVGFPTAAISGPYFARYISKKIKVNAPPLVEQASSETAAQPSLITVLFVIGLPLVLIVVKTLLDTFNIIEGLPVFIGQSIALIGHPFGALLVANLMAWYYLGRKRAVSTKDLNQLANRSMAPAGLIILLTGAGGTFKQMLITTNAGKMLAEVFIDQGVPILVFAFLAAVCIRLLQGSATVAMITAAGLTAPLMNDALNAPQKALLVLAIAAGASILSHVNDSGFWLVSKYLGLNEKQTFQSWSIMTLLIALVGFTLICLLWFVI
ncbi:MAG: GntP family permease [Flavobacteriaceae bacterium]